MYAVGIPDLALILGNVTATVRSCQIKSELMLAYRGGGCFSCGWSELRTGLQA